MTINHQTFTIICVDQITVQVYATFKNLEIIPFPFLLAIWRLFYAYINCPSYPLILMQSRINQIMTNIRKIFSSILLLLWSPRPSPPRHQANQKNPPPTSPMKPSAFSSSSSGEPTSKQKITFKLKTLTPSPTLH